MLDKNCRLQRRKKRIKVKIKLNRFSSKTSENVYRLCLKKTNCHLRAQIIDDMTGHTIIAVDTMRKRSKDDIKKYLCNKSNAFVLGQEISELAKKQNIKYIVFDRSGYKYHGVVKSFADGARNIVDNISYGLRF